MRVAPALAAILCLMPFAGCLSNDSGPIDGPAGSTDDPAGRNHATRFIALGDMGMGNAQQVKVAAAIETVCADLGCDFAVGLGDNIYPSGAETPNDPQFETKFEIPYANLSFPFYMVLGNHDNGQNPTGAPAGEGGLGVWFDAGNNEVAYSLRTDRSSDKWHMPDRHYTFFHGNTDFIGLDTNTFMWFGAAISIDPAIVQEIQQQEDWLPGAVQSMNKTWRIGLGHHPYLSNSEHGNAGEYDAPSLHLVPGKNGDHFKEVFDRELCDKLDFYLAGHDHALQWLTPTASCGKTQFIVSGGGGAGLYDIVGTEPVLFQESIFGFFWIEIKGNTFTAVIFDDEAKELYSGSFTKAD